MIASSMSFDDVQAPQPCVRRNSATQQIDLSHLFGYAAPPTPPGQPRVEIISHTYSAAQEAYNTARGHDDGATFYKDATPRSDHHLKVSVRVPGVAYAATEDLGGESTDACDVRRGLLMLPGTHDDRGRPRMS